MAWNWPWNRKKKKEDSASQQNAAENTVGAGEEKISAHEQAARNLFMIISAGEYDRDMSQLHAEINNLNRLMPPIKGEQPDQAFDRQNDLIYGALLELVRANGASSLFNLEGKQIFTAVSLQLEDMNRTMRPGSVETLEMSRHHMGKTPIHRS